MEADLAFFGDSARLDPAEAAVLAALLAWARRGPTWLSGEQPLQAAWATAAAAPSRSVRGRVTATQAALRRLGWFARGSFDWSDGAGDRVPLEDLARIRELAHRDFRRKEWAAVAARREDFDGCADGVDEEITGREVRSLLR